MKKLVFSDINGTLMDHDGKYNASYYTLKNSISTLEEHGYKFGIFSDSPLPPLKTFLKNISGSGNILAENGTLLFNFETERKEKLQYLENIDEIKQDIIEEVSKMDEDILFFEEYISPEFEACVPNNNIGEYGIAFGKYRECTISLFALEISNQNGSKGYIEHPETASIIMKAIPKALKNYVDKMDWYGSIEHGFFSIQPGKCKHNKEDAIKRISENEKIIVIGDDERDIVMSKNVSCALVSNAQNDLKQHATFVSNKPFTQGVIDIIEKIKSGYFG